MANEINCFVDNMQLNSSNSLTHLLNTDDNEELNVIRHSPYISDDQLLQYRSITQNGLSVFSLNCQSLHAKFDYIKLLIETFQLKNCALQVVCLQETWVSSDTDLSLYMIPGYHLISTSHYASSHGGLIMYLSKKWDYSIKTCDTTSNIWERQIVEIFNPNASQRRKIIVGNIYRPPNNSRENFNIFINKFNDTLLEFYANNQNTYLCGNYNVDLLKISSIQAREEYFDNILSSDYVPTVTLPTRLSNNSSLIDNVFTTNLSPDLFSCVIDVHISDHQPVILFSDDDLPQIRAKYITIKTNTKEARKQFHDESISKQVFHQLDSNIHVADPNQNYGILEKALKETHLVFFPEQVVRFNKKKHKETPWITVGILKSINRRIKLYKSLKKTQLNSISYATKKSNFNQYRNRLGKTIALAKRMYYKTIFEQYKQDMKKNLGHLIRHITQKSSQFFIMSSLLYCYKYLTYIVSSLLYCYKYLIYIVSSLLYCYKYLTYIMSSLLYCYKYLTYNVSSLLYCYKYLTYIMPSLFYCYKYLTYIVSSFSLLSLIVGVCCQRKPFSASAPK